MTVDLGCVFFSSAQGFPRVVYIFLCQAPPHQSPEYALSLFRRGCAPAYPQHRQPMLEGGCLPCDGKKGSAVRIAEVLLLQVLCLAQPQIIHLCDIKLCHLSIILSQDIFLQILKTTSLTPKGHDIKQLGKDTQDAFHQLCREKNR